MTEHLEVECFYEHISDASGRRIAFWGKIFLATYKTIALVSYEMPVYESWYSHPAISSSSNSLGTITSPSYLNTTYTMTLVTAGANLVTNFAALELNLCFQILFDWQ